MILSQLPTRALTQYLIDDDSPDESLRNVPKSIVARELRKRGIAYSFQTTKRHVATETDEDVIRHIRSGWSRSAIMAKFNVGIGYIMMLKTMHDVDNYFENKHYVANGNVRAEI